MRFNNKIRSKGRFISKEGRIYDVSKALRIYHAEKFSFRKLSMMKQENIRCALRSKNYKIEDIKKVIIRKCGYCFEYPSCMICPLHKGLNCYHLADFNLMECSKRKETFASYHKSWCKQLGIWDKEWI